MIVYRVSTSKYIDDLTGAGARLYGGRWNGKGTPLLYCSENVSLAILEVQVHFDGLTVPDNLELLQLEIDESQVKSFSRMRFDKIRKSKDAEFRFIKAGQNWIESGSSLALRVPSVIVPFEFNVLVNPVHQNFDKLQRIKRSMLELDGRLLKTR